SSLFFFFIFFCFCFFYFCFFFFQAEDGIRDRNVTGVQTCALPISAFAGTTARFEETPRTMVTFYGKSFPSRLLIGTALYASPARSEERRVGKECRSRWSPRQSTKKEGHASVIRPCKQPCLTVTVTL